MSDTPTYGAQSVLSKKRFNEIVELLEKRYGRDGLDDVIKDFCDIMKFDPSGSRYTPELGKKMIESRRKRAELLGVSTYVTGGGKKAYEKKKKMQST